MNSRATTNTLELTFTAAERFIPLDCQATVASSLPKPGASGNCNQSPTIVPGEGLGRVDRFDESQNRLFGHMACNVGFGDDANQTVVLEYQKPADLVSSIVSSISSALALHTALSHLPYCGGRIQALRNAFDDDVSIGDHAAQLAIIAAYRQRAHVECRACVALQHSSSHFRRYK
nr:hypothetical protein [Mycobacterium xenopi]